MSYYNFDKFKKYVFPKGQYKFEIEYCDVNALSKKNNPSLSLKLKVTHGDKESVIKATHSYEMIHLIKHLCESIGKPELYETGAFTNEDLLGQKGIVSLGIDQYNGDDKNFVEDYVKKNGESEDFPDDATPF